MLMTKPLESQASSKLLSMGKGLGRAAHPAPLVLQRQDSALFPTTEGSPASVPHFKTPKAPDSTAQLPLRFDLDSSGLWALDPASVSKADSDQGRPKSVSGLHMHEYIHLPTNM